MTVSANSAAVTYAKAQGVKTAAETGDRIEWVKLSSRSCRWLPP
jgi:hypothetical protein